MGNALSELSEKNDKNDKNDKKDYITRAEFNEYVRHVNSELEFARNVILNKKEDKHQRNLIKTERELVAARNEIKELQKQIAVLTKINANLNAKVTEASGFSAAVLVQDNKEMQLQEVSKKRIDEVVNSLLADENINMKYFPDWVEKQLYRNVITLMINLCASLLDTASVKCMGHEMTFDLHPIDSQPNKTE